MAKRSTKKYIHVNQHKIRSNLKHGKNEPVITIKQGSTNTYCHEVDILGPSKIVYGGNDKPLFCVNQKYNGIINLPPLLIGNEFNSG